jgi:hypothetical protein
MECVSVANRRGIARIRNQVSIVKGEGHLTGNELDLFLRGVGDQQRPKE